MTTDNEPSTDPSSATEAGLDPTSFRDRARSFDRGASDYALSRPGYPPSAVAWLLPDDADPRTHVLDLAAGTGKLTASLVALGLRVTAVEPSDAMRDELHTTLPSVHALPGLADAIPLPDASVDAVVVGQAWHWFTPETAAPEIARVLRPGGRLGLVWNVRDETVDWVDELARIIHRGDTLPPSSHSPGLAIEEHGPFEPAEHTTVPWTDRTTPSGLRTLAASRSYVLTLPAAARRLLLDDVDRLTSHHPDLEGRTEISLPYRAECWRTTRTS
ncbi:class I SAM-dependent methyltransferase [Sanguibacter antarcticus]|uniref:Methyltransferase family protein n=1 Tax=Sanguibacter antarcticus TaxID=372484 RepID=A0A2A9E294_9MICO|nr:class I SAM-dependent methyltransferase [Sanguibacter antarcticus]PFG32701.1 methyltransferase family protein [Sanguibacter antarcticus]